MYVVSEADLKWYVKCTFETQRIPGLWLGTVLSWRELALLGTLEMRERMYHST